MIRQSKRHVVAVNAAMDDDPDLFFFAPHGSHHDDDEATGVATAEPSEKVLHVLFVSTTGDGEQPDNMKQIWRKLYVLAFTRDQALQCYSYTLFSSVSHE
jgi:sulfite reductase alpha subunit-like flavoprotein